MRGSTRVNKVESLRVGKYNYQDKISTQGPCWSSCLAVRRPTIVIQFPQLRVRLPLDPLFFFSPNKRAAISDGLRVSVICFWFYFRVQGLSHCDSRIIVDDSQASSTFLIPCLIRAQPLMWPPVRIVRLSISRKLSAFSPFIDLIIIVLIQLARCPYRGISFCP